MEHSHDMVSRWLRLIENKDLKGVVADIEGKHISVKSALDCIILISQSLYNHVKKDIPFDGSPEDVVLLTDYFSSMVRLDVKTNGDKYLRSIYHILSYFISEGHLEHVSHVFENILWMKKYNKHLYKHYGQSLHENFISLVKSSINKAMPPTLQQIPISNVMALFSTLLELCKDDYKINGKTFLQTLLHFSSVLSKRNYVFGVQLISHALDLFYKVDNYQDANCCLPIILNLYELLFSCELKHSDYCTALKTVSEHLEQVRLKFSECLDLEKSIVVLCNTVDILLLRSNDVCLIKKIQENSKYFELLNNESKKDEFVCTLDFISTILVNSHKLPPQTRPIISKNYLKPILEMILKIYKVLEKYHSSEVELVQLLGCIFGFLLDAKLESEVNILKSCLAVIHETEQYLLGLLYGLQSTKDRKSDFFSWQALVRITNVVRILHLAALTEEVQCISKNVCKFIYSLPDDTFIDPGTQIQQIAENCFCYLASSLGTKQLDKVLECLVALMVKVPQLTKKAFKLWGDYKHNTVCEGGVDYLELTVWDVISKEGLTVLDCTFHLSDAEVAKLLVEELKIYFTNKHLRGKPVIAAVDILLSLKSDSMTQVKGLVIGIDVATSTKNYADQCLKYYTASKSLLKQAMKQKSNYNPVEYNCSMGNLMYAQLRCLLNKLRMACETELIKLSSEDYEPLIQDMPEDRPDPNDTCIINTRYVNLSLAKQRRVMENLDSVLKHWEIAYSSMIDENNSTYDITVTLENMKDLGFLLKLYCDEMRQCKLWKLLYNMALFVKRPNFIVTAVGELMNLHNGVEMEWIEKAEDYIKSSAVCPKVKQTYLLNSALHKLHVNEVMQGVELLSALGGEIKNNNIQYTQFLFVVGCFQKHRDWYKYEYKFDMIPSYHFSFHKSLSYLLYLAEEEKWSTFAEACQIHLQLLQLSQYLGEVNWSLKQPREARCYLKSQLPLAQKLALPLRTVQLLVILAWVDFVTGAIVDCVVKLKSLENLLELFGTPIKYEESVSSPTLGTKTVLSMPQYIKHAPDCICLPCTTLEYRRLVLETITLRASFCAAYGQINDALQCFEVAIQVQDELRKSSKSEVLHSCARMWLRYAEVMGARQRNEQDANIANSKALQFIPPQEASTIQYALRMKCNINRSILVADISERQIKYEKVNKENSTPTKSQVWHFKTPDKVAYPVKSPLADKNYNVTPVTPFTRPVRRIKLPSFDDENSPKVASAVKRQTRIPSKIVSETPQSNRKTTRTPFVVYEEKPVRTSKYKKTKSTVKIKECSKSDDTNNEISKKKLFASSNSPDLFSDFISKLPGSDDVTECSRTCLKSYERKKPNGCTRSNKSEESKKSENVFEFNKLKNAIDTLEDEIEGTPEKGQSSFFSRSLRNKKGAASNSLSHTYDSKNRSDQITTDISNSDFIEGTPPPEPMKSIPLNIRSKRTTRARK